MMNKTVIFKIKTFFLTLFFVLLHLACQAQHTDNFTGTLTINAAIDPGNAFVTSAGCPAQNDINKSIVEDFLTKPQWSSKRAETNTGNLTVSQISLLTDSNHQSVCVSLNNIYQEALDEENSLGEPAYNVTYYQAGSFYFVVITIRQSNNPIYVAVGVSFIAVYNQNLNLIKGYAF